MTNKQLICKKCSGPRENGRRLCRECHLAGKREAAKLKPRYMYNNNCIVCNQSFSAWRKHSVFCSDCWKFRQSLSSESVATNNYARAGDETYWWLHRKIAEQVLGRKLSTNEVVHHMDHNPTNNTLGNLLVISRSMHGRLHKYLATQRAIFEKSKIENIENCWNSLIAPMTTAWLETTGAKVVKLWEIGQSAAELPIKEEGSETMHDVPVTDKAVGKDIVQTTTETASES